MLTLVRDLLAHAEWANAEFFRAWGASPAREHEELRRRVEHVVGVQSGFLSVLRGEEPGGPTGAPPQPYAGLKEWAESNHGGWRAYAAGLDDATLTRTVHVKWFPDPPCVVTTAQALAQVVMHSQHHRGQLMTRLKDFGGEPANVDFIIWLWRGRPAPRWS